MWIRLKYFQLNICYTDDTDRDKSWYLNIPNTFFKEKEKNSWECKLDFMVAYLWGGGGGYFLGKCLHPKREQRWQKRETYFQKEIYKFIKRGGGVEGRGHKFPTPQKNILAMLLPPTHPTTPIPNPYALHGRIQGGGGLTGHPPPPPWPGQNDLVSNFPNLLVQFCFWIIPRKCQK